jgi:hypothetical protein
MIQEEVVWFSLSRVPRFYTSLSGGHQGDIMRLLMVSEELSKPPLGD